MGNSSSKKKKKSNQTQSIKNPTSIKVTSTQNAPNSTFTDPSPTNPTTIPSPKVASLTNAPNGNILVVGKNHQRQLLINQQDLNIKELTPSDLIPKNIKIKHVSFTWDCTIMIDIDNNVHIAGSKFMVHYQ